MQQSAIFKWFAYYVAGSLWRIKYHVAVHRNLRCQKLPLIESPETLASMIGLET